jgi:drug/metabolite transporter (DMT)-like permease
VLQEAVSLSTLIGTVLVIGGIALVNSRFGTRPLFSRDAAAPSREAAPQTGTGRS